MRIQHNIMAMNAYRNYNTNTSALSKNLEKLSSGYKINRAGDDAAGLAISEKMRAQITGLDAAANNVKDGISLVKTAEGAMQEVQDMLNRMVDLATQSANGTYQDEVDREALQAEIDQLNAEIDRIADSANFNGIKLLDGSLSATGGKGASTQFTVNGGSTFGDLPDVGTILGSDTVLHNTAAQGNTGTSFGVDLHNTNISNEAGKEFTIAVGSGSSAITITLAGQATGTANTYEAADIVDMLTSGKASEITAKGFTLSVNGVATAGTTSFEFKDGVLTLHGAAGSAVGDITITKGNEGNNRLVFTQANRPTADGTVAEWAPANKVTVSFGAAPATTSLTLSADIPVPYATTQPVVTLGSSVALGSSGSVAGAVTGNNTAILALINGSTALGDITLKGSSAGSLTLVIGGSVGTGQQTINVTASFAAASTGAVITIKSSNGSAVMTITLASTATTATAASTALLAKTASGLKVGTYANTETDDTVSKATIASASFGSTGSAALTAIKNANTVGSTGFFKSETVATVASVTLTSVIGSAAFAAFASVASAGASIGSAVVAALKTAQIKVGDITASIASSAVKASMTASAALKVVVDALNKAAAEKAKTDYAALGSSGSITVYSDFKFVNGSGTVVAQAANNPFDGVTLTYKTTTLSTQSDDSDDDAAAGVTDFDYNVSTTDINRVTVDGGNRLASTFFTLTDKEVVDGASVRIGNDTYTFSSNKAAAGKEGVVDISDLMDSEGNWNDPSTGLTKALERLTAAASDNEVYTVGYDGSRITVTERTDWNNKDTSSFDLTTKEGVAKSLGYTAAGAKSNENGGLVLQIGDTSESFNQLTVEIGDIHASALGVADINVGTQKGAQEAINVIKNAINQVSSIRGTLGATQNRLEHTSNNLSVMAENIQDAESSIRDTDVAEEMMSYVKNNILVQSAQAMLAQANQVPQGVLQLLG